MQTSQLVLSKVEGMFALLELKYNANESACPEQSRRDVCIIGVKV